MPCNQRRFQRLILSTTFGGVAEMKFRIVKNKFGEYAVQYRPWFFPFWILDAIAFNGDGFKDLNTAQVRLIELKVQWEKNHSPKWKEIK